MATLKIKKESIPVLKSSLKMKEKLLKFKLQNYQRKLSKFEKKYGMGSAEFKQKFEEGKLGDEAYPIEWEYLLDSYDAIKDQLDQIRQIKL